uniref:Uncharacterized protein n=1 Tax=Rhizophagus irregularis (strain DAOM 181602 / DAOM 197198 / MUCL 43194) TaxID=747089 RepID=U9US82_RHIID
MGTILADSNEAMRCEYILVILQLDTCIFHHDIRSSLYIVKRITKKEITLAPQLEIVGEENTGRVDYTIKALEELICITEGILYQVSALKENSEDEKELCKNVKRVIEVIFGLLKDRIDVEKEPAMKKQRVQEVRPELNDHNNSLFSKIIWQKQTSSNKSAFILVLFEDIINPASLKTLSLAPMLLG